jgi:hypothetical protein
MFKYIFNSMSSGKSAWLISLTTLILIAYSPSAFAENITVLTKTSYSNLISNHPSLASNPSDDITETTVQTDPLNSPHPVPWEWVMKTYTELTASGKTGIRYYRSPSLISPDGNYAAYSRISIEVLPELYRTRVSSVMFLENLHTGHLQTVTASSPLADNPFNSNEEAELPGAISILIPVSWSADGNRLLSRQFEGLFSTSDASDFAVIWDRVSNTSKTLAPVRVQYSNAILLGWDDKNHDQVLFRAGILGDENWGVWAVDMKGETKSASQEQPKIFGELIQQVWAGPQTY